MSRLVPLFFRLQKMLLVVGYRYYSRPSRLARARTISWVVGPNEIASMVFQLAAAIPDSYSVNLSARTYYGFTYDSMITRGGSGRIASLRRLISSPLLLARLSAGAKGIIYVGSTGFLLDQFDRRRFEFGFLRSKGVHIVCYWTGSDIRSTRRMNALERRTGLANISTYIGTVNPVFGTEAHEKALKEVAAVADEFADAMFSNSTDHLSYLTRGTEPFLYFLPDDEFVTTSDKFDDLSRIVVAHATTSPVIKGTQLVRSAVAKLRSEGYDFEYRELIGVGHDVIMNELARTHIALNQFYGFSTAVFGMEALASRCAVLMSADRTIEPDLQEGANDAWLVTRNYEVYDNLKRLLDDPDQIEPLAARGEAWAFEFGSRSHAGPVLRRTLDAVLAGTYVAPPVATELVDDYVEGERR